MADLGHGHVNATAFYEGITEKDGVSDTWAGQGHTTCVLNLPLGYFYQEPRVWGDLQNTAASALLRTLAWIATESSLGNQSYGARYYCAQGKPKTMQIWEPLWNSLTSPKRTVVGYRLWFVVLDPELHIPNGFRKLIEKNNDFRKQQEEFAQTRTRRMNGSASAAASNHEAKFVRASGILTGGMTSAPEERIYDERTLVDRVFAVYRGVTSGCLPDANAHAMYSSDLLSANSPSNPRNVLDAGASFRLHMTGVCPEQRTLSNYFSEDDIDQGLFDYTAKFPPGADAYSVLPHYFQPDFLMGSPLPHVARHRLGPLYQIIIRNTVRRNELEAEREEMQAREDMVGMRCAEEDIMEATDNIQKASEDMDDMFLAIRRSAPSTIMGMGTLADSFSTSYVEEIIRDRNDFRKHWESNSARLKALHAEFEMETVRMRERNASPDEPVRVGGMVFPDAVASLRVDAFDQFWRTFRTSVKVPAPVDAARSWMNDLVQEKTPLYTRQFQCAKNLTPFGNMIVRMTSDFGDALEVETNFQLMHLTLYVVMCGARYGFGLRPNLFITGEAGVGKSFCVEAVKHITIPGATLNLTHMTTHALNGSDDFSGTCIIMEEVPLDKIGIDKYGNVIPSDPYLKNRLTASLSVTMAQDTSKGEETSGSRKSKMYVSVCMVTHILISNDRLPPESSPLMSRFIPYVMRKIENTRADGEDRTLALDLQNQALDESKTTVLLGAKLQNLYLFIWEMAISDGAMPDVDTTVARIVSKWIFTELAKRKVPTPSRRHVGMMLDICRIVTMYYGVHMEYFSEFAFARREIMRKQKRREQRRQTQERRQRREVRQRYRRNFDEEARNLFRAMDGSEEEEEEEEEEEDGSSSSDGDEADDAQNNADEEPAEDFNPQSLEGLIKWGVVTQEVVVFVISLLEFLWVPQIRSDVARAASVLAGGAIVDGKWKPDEYKTEFRRDFDESMMGFGMNFNAPPAAAAAPPPMPAPRPPPPPMPSRDAMRNVASRGRQASAEDQEAVQQWLGSINEAPPAGAGAGAAPPPPLAPPRRGRPPLPCTSLDYRYIEVCGSTRLEVAQRIRKMLPNPPSENDIVSALTAMSGDYIECARREFVDVTDQFGQVIGHELRTVPGAQHELIRCVIMDDIPEKFAVGGRNRRICIAIDLVDQDFSTALKESIREALSHEFQQTREYITAFPYTRVVPMAGDNDVSGIGQPSSKVQTLHNVFDTVRVDQRQGVIREISNKYARTSNEVNLLLNAGDRKLTKLEKEQIRRTQTPRFALRCNLDHACLLNYWRKHGIDSSSVGPAYAPMAREIILAYHTTMPHLFAKTSKRMVDNYPEDWVRSMDERRNEIDSLTTADLMSWNDDVGGSSGYYFGAGKPTEIVNGQDVLHAVPWHRGRNGPASSMSLIGNRRAFAAIGAGLPIDATDNIVQNALKDTSRSFRARKRVRLPF